MKLIHHLLFKCLLVLIAATVVFKFAVVPLMPQSIFSFYFIVIVVGLVVYVTSTSQNMQDFWEPIETLLTNHQYVTLRWVIFLLIPSVAAVSAGLALLPSNQAPIALRVVHPAPPTEIDFDGKEINLATAVNPFRKYQKEDPEEFAKHLKAGRKVYYENCHFCHGDYLAGNGIFAKALDPKPANFQDIGTIAQLQESYVFWRVAQGGPGLPKESMPWQTAMPAWQGMLSETEIWEVTLFLYDFTNHPPRTWE